MFFHLLQCIIVISSLLNVTSLRIHSTLHSCISQSNNDKNDTSRGSCQLFSSNTHNENDYIAFGTPFQRPKIANSIVDVIGGTFT